MFVEYSLLQKKHYFEFCWSSLADEHTTLPKATRRHVKLDKFVFGTPWLLDLFCKHWFASSVWNFCRWVADVPPRETSPAAKSEEKRMFSQANYPRGEWVDTYLKMVNVSHRTSWVIFHCGKIFPWDNVSASIPDNQYKERRIAGELNETE